MTRIGHIDFGVVGSLEIVKIHRFSKKITVRVTKYNGSCRYITMQENDKHQYHFSAEVSQ